jgi:hypothetical protein
VKISGNALEWEVNALQGRFHHHEREKVEEELKVDVKAKLSLLLIKHHAVKTYPLLN